MKKNLFTFYQKLVKNLTGTNLSIYRIIQKINNKINSNLKPNFVEIDGNKIYLDEKDSLFLSVYGFHEKTETEIVKNEIREGDIVLDIGANIGYYTLLFAKLVGEKGKVYAFEAESSNFEILKKNVYENNYNNVILEQKAVSNESGTVKFYIGKDSNTENQLFKPNVKHEEIEVKSISIDGYFKELNPKIDFVKIDIQGAEPLVIEGMTKIIEENKDLKIMLEWWPDAIRKYGIDPSKHLTQLVNLGFKIFEIDDKNATCIKTDIETLMKKYPNKKLEDVNLLLKKNNE